jgi:hypothetical protein
MICIILAHFHTGKQDQLQFSSILPSLDSIHCNLHVKLLTFHLTFRILSIAVLAGTLD